MYSPPDVRSQIAYMCTILELMHNPLDVHPQLMPHPQADYCVVPQRGIEGCKPRPVPYTGGGKLWSTGVRFFAGLDVGIWAWRFRFEGGLAADSALQLTKGTSVCSTIKSGKFSHARCPEWQYSGQCTAKINLSGCLNLNARWYNSLSLSTKWLSAS